MGVVKGRSPCTSCMPTWDPCVPMITSTVCPLLHGRGSGFRIQMHQLVHNMPEYLCRIRFSGNRDLSRPVLSSAFFCVQSALNWRFHPPTNQSRLGISSSFALARRSRRVNGKTSSRPSAPLQFPLKDGVVAFLFSPFTVVLCISSET
jgi:hypothetical protein